ncbi:MAG: 7-cyano-7-deazaguanine synthase QueC [Candidatus Methanosuratincola sp.]|jgi:7-cyano-7-deazaguanine synthase
MGILIVFTAGMRESPMTTFEDKREAGGKRAVLSVSGGIDSTTLLYKALCDGLEPFAITFIYGQKHSREIDCASTICKRLGVVHKVLDLSPLREVFLGSALTDERVEVPEVPETSNYQEALKSTIVPNRNAIFLSVATGYAVSIGAKIVLFGAHSSDRGVYPDCRAEFVEAFTIAERIAIDDTDFAIRAPFVGMDKRDIVRLGASLGVPYECTWSCYKGGEVHCGVCSSCRERKRAFLEAEVRDPTTYAI